MLKRNWALIALVYLLLAEALSWAPVSDLVLCLVQPEHSEQAADYDNKKYCAPFHVGAALAFEKADHWLERHDKSVLGAFTIVLAISTIGLWLATNKLWVAGERQLGHLSDTAERQLRAYVHVLTIEVRNFDSGQPLSAHIQVKNSGQTPAYKAAIRMAMGGRLLPVAESDFIIPEVPEDSRAIIAAGDTLNAGVQQPDALNEPAKRLLISGAARIFVFGEITYVDAFKVKRTTKFRAVNGSLAGRNPGDLISFNLTAEGNEAD